MFAAIAAFLIGSSYAQPVFSQDEEPNEWPQEIAIPQGKVVVYQPQPEELDGNTLKGRAAVAVEESGSDGPIFGAVWFTARLETDRANRTATLVDMEVTQTRFPERDEAKAEKLKELLESEFPNWEMELSLDELLADLEMEEVNAELAENLNNTPPEIIFATTPTMLIMVDGDPHFEQIEKTNYERVINTPYFVVKDTKHDKYYINGSGKWYVSDNFDTWETTTKVPNKLKNIAKEALKDEEAEKAEEASGEDEGVVKDEDVIPAIVLRTSAAELLQSDGEPEYEPIEGTSILYMSNTADDILMNIETQEYYVLVAGRWYSSKSITDGPWAFVNPENIPEGFSSIPADSDMGSVLSSIAGTQEAKEALLENHIPQTAEVDRTEAKLEVSYDGEPKFEKVGETNMKYAVNTDKSVLQIDNLYYCCDNAIWFESDSPKGPWVVSTEVPESVQEIPPESPVYNVKYVYIYDSTPEVVYVGYTPGYVHSYSYMGCVYYGTGYYYQPWYGAYYYPRPVTYGYSVHWNPYTGWGFSFGVSYGWMTFGWGSPYRGWWGPTGYRHGYHYGYRHGYHNGYRAGYRAGYHAGQRAGYNRPSPYSNRPMHTNNAYKNRSQGVRKTGNQQYNPRTGDRVASTDRSRPAAQPANRPNNMYTDPQGNVFQKSGNDWNRVDNGGGSSREARPSTGNTTRPSTGQQPSTGNARPSTGQQPSQSDRASNSYTRPGSTGSSNATRDYNSRSQGQARSQQYQQSKPNYQQSRPSQSSRSASPSRSMGSRPSGGGRRR